MADIEKTLTGSDGLKRNTGKVLSDYRPVSKEDDVDPGAQYLKENASSTLQMQEQSKTDADVKREAKDNMLHDKELHDKELHMDVEDQKGSPFQYEPELMAGVQELEQQEQQQRIQRQLVLDQNEMDALHARLKTKIEEAINAEKQRASDLRAIESKKKRTMDFARMVYGDNADLDYIMDSAAIAKENRSPDMRRLSNQISAHIDNFVHQKDDVIVASRNGVTRTMDREVAEVMALHTSKSGGNKILDKLFGRGTTVQKDYDVSVLSPDVAEKYSAFVFSEEELKGLSDLERMMSENDKSLQKYEQKAPDGMSQEEYMKLQRDRRLAEYGNPMDGLPYDYMFADERLYLHNGRPLPKQMSSSPELAAKALDKPLELESQPEYNA